MNKYYNKVANIKPIKSIYNILNIDYYFINAITSPLLTRSP